MLRPNVAPQTNSSGHLDLCPPEARKYILAAAILASSLGFIDASIVAIALPAMRASLNATLTQAQWISNAYMLSLTALILLGGATGDRFGLARVFRLGIAVFVIASIICALAPSAKVLIFARGIQGIGAAFMVPGSLALISRAYPKGERSRAIGIWAASAAVTSALGPIIGGIVLTVGSVDAWRWIFAINLPLGAVAVYLISSRIERDPAQPSRGIDIPGALLATVGLGCIALALKGDGHGNLLHINSLIFAMTGLASVAAFIWVEARSPHPMMPLSLFRSPGFSAANAISFVTYFAFGAILIYLPMAVIGAWGVSEIETAAAYAPLSIFIALLSGPAGRLASRFGAAPILMFGSLVLTIGYAALALVIPTQNFWGAVMPAMVMQGIGMGLIVAPSSTAIMNSVDDENSGTASGVNNAVTRMAGLIAVAAIGSVAAMFYSYADGPLSFGEISNDPDHASATNTAFSIVAWLAAGFCMKGVLLAWKCMPWMEMNKKR